MLDLAAIFGAGVLTFLTPCVLPLVPIYLGALAGGDLRAMERMGRGQLVGRAALFSAGFIAVFTSLGLGASSIGAFLAGHQAVVQAVGALLIALFGLKFLGLVRLPWLDRTVRGDDRKLQTRLGWLNALVMGLVFAAGWSPCVGPVLGSVLTYTASTTSDPWTGAGYLAVYGLGFSVPLVGLALFAEAAMGLVSRLGRHLRKVELALGVGLLLVAGAMVLDALPVPPAPVDAVQEQGLVTEQGAGPVMLAFTSPSCPICRRMEPVIARMAERCDGQGVRVRTIDLSTAEGRDLARRYRLVGVPTFVFADGQGMEVARLVGEQEEPSLARAVSALRGEPCPGLAILDKDGSHLDPADLDLLGPDTSTPIEAPRGKACKIGEAHDPITCQGV